jgi:hypothetical protein
MSPAEFFTTSSQLRMPPAIGTVNKVVRFRSRKSDERLLARMAFDVENSGVADHNGAPLSLSHPSFPMQPQPGPCPVLLA